MWGSVFNVGFKLCASLHVVLFCGEHCVNLSQQNTPAKPSMGVTKVVIFVVGLQGTRGAACVHIRD